jgi:phenylalanyl-tRNA synthetase beta chain
MKVLYNWLKDFVDITAAPADLAQRMAMCGVPVESLDDSPAGPLLDLEIFSNRGDLLGHLGVAREIAALYRTRVKPVQPKLKEAAEKAESAARVEIECPDLCGRFTARVIRGVKVAPSPDWLRQRLEALGQQSINNVVDATNYVMLELGHPLHAFDLEKLAGRRIVVRRARPGEKFRTLDGVERQLNPGMCMVCDAERSAGIGGVMGGADSEIGFATKNILLECAWFDPISIRRTAKTLGLRTEASTRFERGLDPEMAELASRRCAELIQQLAGGEILAGVVDAYPARRAPEKIEITRKELLRVMGADVPDRDLEEILAALGFAPVRVDSTRGSANSLMAAWQCTRATWRPDVAGETDLIEEVARHYGFEKFPPRLPAAKLPAARLPHAAAQDAIRERLVGLGYHEIVTIPLVDPQRDAVFRAEGTTPTGPANPLAEDASQLRTSGLVNMLQTLEWNINRGQQNVRLFEIGRKYELRDGQPVETPILTLGVTGLAREKSIHEPAREYSFADLKGELDALGELAGGLRWRSGGDAWLHPARCGTVALNGGADVGVCGQLAARVAEPFKLRQDVFVAELLLAPLYEAQDATRAARHYRPLPRFPAVERDFSLVLADGTAFAQVEEAIRALGIEEVESVAAVDLFRGGQIPKGKFSLLVRVVFQSHAATLTEAQLSDFHARIVSALEQKLGASLRA